MTTFQLVMQDGMSLTEVNLINTELTTMERNVYLQLLKIADKQPISFLDDPVNTPVYFDAAPASTDGLMETLDAAKSSIENAKTGLRQKGYAVFTPDRIVLGKPMVQLYNQGIQCEGVYLHAFNTLTTDTGILTLAQDYYAKDSSRPRLERIEPIVVKQYPDGTDSRELYEYHCRINEELENYEEAVDAGYAAWLPKVLEPFVSGRDFVYVPSQTDTWPASKRHPEGRTVTSKDYYLVTPGVALYMLRDLCVFDTLESNTHLDRIIEDLHNDSTKSTSAYTIKLIDDAMLAADLKANGITITTVIHQ